ncbi:hypothetical protein HH213_11095 [Duganella dendranthematis]|jgi:hypothetical protein|uniref:Nuclear transport factor 2 family protein n=1 Tax=Duganella dendranthematis TaxID=2728021 RepID=A0ABX6M8C7_9BURK|nr:hypothetical protein [Duganella dendranthematis]QJD90580.1 hypothetical protein HH213_11095 [Duganella dendranthematis]
MHPLIQLREAGASAEEIGSILAREVVFKSPILSRNVIGRDAVARTMVGAIAVREGSYISEISDGNVTLLVWRGTIDGLPLDSFEMLLHDDDGLIIERSVAMRPFSSVLAFRKAFHDRMKDVLDPSYFALPSMPAAMRDNS